MAYASETTVPVSKTQNEIEALLQAHGATGFARSWQAGCAVLAFEMRGRRIRYVLPLPSEDDPEIRRTPTGRSRNAAQCRIEAERAGRSRWRALLLIIRAKLEAVSAGIVTLEDEFQPWTVMPNGLTVREWLEPQLQRALATQEMPSLMPGLPALMSGEQP